MIFRLCRSVDCTERGGKQVTIMNKRNVKFIVLSPLIDFISIIIECNIKFTSSLGKISYTLLNAQNEPTCQKRASLCRSLSHLRLDRGSDGLFMFSGSTVVIRPRSI